MHSLRYSKQEIQIIINLFAVRFSLKITDVGNNFILHFNKHQ